LSDIDLQKHIKLRHNDDDNAEKDIAAAGDDVQPIEKSTSRKEDADDGAEGLVHPATANAASSSVLAIAVDTVATTKESPVVLFDATAATAAAPAAPQSHNYDSLSKVVSLRQQQVTPTHECTWRVSSRLLSKVFAVQIPVPAR
jgi:hypothetical protein